MTPLDSPSCAEAPAEVEALVHEVDALMYEVKNNGKDGVLQRSWAQAG
ncbi:MAG: hypothetical protein M5U26_27940 [Planctomycetota bacterium]|nr:hypothetical protein [Planctomycetota bacterium]